MVTRTFEKAMKKLPLNIQLKIREKVIQLSRNPYTGSVLKGYKRKYWKIRVGNYRVIYRVDSLQKTIFLIFVDHRSAVYRNL